MLLLNIYYIILTSNFRPYFPLPVVPSAKKNWVTTMDDNYYHNYQNYNIMNTNMIAAIRSSIHSAQISDAAAESVQEPPHIVKRRPTFSSFKVGQMLTCFSCVLFIVLAQLVDCRHHDLKNVINCAVYSKYFLSHSLNAANHHSTTWHQHHITRVPFYVPTRPTYRLNGRLCWLTRGRCVMMMHL